MISRRLSLVLAILVFAPFSAYASCNGNWPAGTVCNAKTAGATGSPTHDVQIGNPGATVGTLSFGNATSGTIKLQPVTGTLGSSVLSLPAATDTIVGKATSDVFTNKTLDTAGTGNVFKINGNTVSAVTGTGSTAVLDTSPTIAGHPTIEGVTSTGATGTGKIVYDNSPSLTTPSLGTPTILNLTNGTSLPLSTGVTGTLPLANGGMGGDQSAAAAQTAPIYPGSAGAAVPTGPGTWLTAACSLSALRTACVTFFGYADPIWYGADNTGAIDSAGAIASAAASSAGLVRITAGTYKWDTSETISANNVEIRCDGGVIINKPTTTVQNVINGTHFTFRNCNVVGPGSATTGNDQMFLVGLGAAADYWTFDHNTFSGFGSPSGTASTVQIYRGDHGRFTNNSFSGNGSPSGDYIPFSLQGGANAMVDVFVSGNSMDAFMSVTGGGGITSLTHLTVVDNHFNAAASAQATLPCVNVLTNSAVNIVDAVVSHNTCALAANVTQNAFAGISGVDGFSEVGNVVDLNGKTSGGYSIECNTCSHGAISDNIIWNCVGASCNPGSFSCEDCRDIIFTGNTTDGWGSGDPAFQFTWNTAVQSGFITARDNNCKWNGSQTTGSCFAFINNTNTSGVVKIVEGGNNISGNGGVGSTGVLFSASAGDQITNIQMGPDNISGVAVGRSLSAGVHTFCFTREINTATAPLSNSTGEVAPYACTIYP
ncbi:MAG: hypothetical protein KGL39_06360 [Patescibacteria group bacterium]|nr:hypothetical protein [Patescibacteria group bacterium]